MNVREALNRGYNLVGTTLVAISGFAFFPQTFSEDEFSHKLDEGGLFLLAIGALIWYFAGKNKVSRTIVPILFAAASLIVKLVAFFLEAGDTADVGDEFAPLLLFALALGFLIWQYISLRRMEEKELVGAAGKQQLQKSFEVCAYSAYRVGAYRSCTSLWEPWPFGRSGTSGKSMVNRRCII